jgi:hypothetical protein
MDPWDTPILLHDYLNQMVRKSRLHLAILPLKVDNRFHVDSVSNSTAQATAVAPLDDSMSASTLALSESTLSAIERQRKQELLARKAVQASRKRKEPVPLAATQASTSPGSDSTGADASAQPSASSVSVDDFLNSIGPPLSDAASPECDSRAAEASGFVKVSSPEPMNIDEIIPGFGRSTFSKFDTPGPPLDRMSVSPPGEDPSPPRSASASERSPSVEQDNNDRTSSSTHRTFHAMENVTTQSRSDGTPGPYLAKDSELDSRRSSSTQPTAPIPRRGSKRPVAADFDSGPMPKIYNLPVPSRTGSGAGGFGYGSGYHPNAHVRRKMNGAAAGGFASLNSARRCVIDVSDSEDDTSGDETPSTPHGHGVGGVQSTAGDSALALELEIERMRKIIREREEMKLRKQAVREAPFYNYKTRTYRGYLDGVKSFNACFQGITRCCPSI